MARRKKEEEKDQKLNPTQGKEEVLAVEEAKNTRAKKTTAKQPAKKTDTSTKKVAEKTAASKSAAKIYWKKNPAKI